MHQTLSLGGQCRAGKEQIAARATLPAAALSGTQAFAHIPFPAVDQPEASALTKKMEDEAGVADHLAGVFLQMFDYKRTTIRPEFIRKSPTRSRWHFLGIFMVCCGCDTWSSHAGFYETHQHGKRCHRAEEFHVSLWLRLPGLAMLVSMKRISTESPVTVPRSSMFRCG
ncbi:MAG: hypothetical protein ACK5PS_04490 [Desulfopila sp.]